MSVVLPHIVHRFVYSVLSSSPEVIMNKEYSGTQTRQEV
jgi:hypothetical protein